jgi:FkbM family methyltransferase
VGANVGFYTVQLGRKLKELGGTLCAFEPVRRNFDRLLEVVQLNGLEGVVRCFNVALGDEDNQVLLRMADDRMSVTGNAAILKKDDTEPSSEDVRAQIARLDGFALGNGIDHCDLVKVDIEGFELMFLRGAASLIQKCHPVIYGEFNYPHMRELGYSASDVIDLAQAWGYRVHKQVGKEEFLGFAQPGDYIDNFLMTHRDIPDGLERGLGLSGRPDQPRVSTRGLAITEACLPGLEPGVSLPGS